MSMSASAAMRPGTKSGGGGGESERDEQGLENKRRTGSARQENDGEDRNFLTQKQRRALDQKTAASKQTTSPLQ
jgi:hypothetical protein